VDIEIVESVDTDELVDLYASVGWEAYASDPEELARAVAGSTWVMTARHDGELIGLARGLSDDVSIFYLQDILVRPEWQRRGVGRAISPTSPKPASMHSSIWRASRKVARSGTRTVGRPVPAPQMRRATRSLTHPRPGAPI